MIVDQDGRPRSVRTDRERREEFRHQLESMTEAERAALFTLLEDIDQGNAHDKLFHAHYEREPVSPERFLLDDYYLGAVGNNMWPQLQKDFVELFEGGYTEAILSGSLGWGKSFFATCGICYVLYQMTCLTNPQEVYGLAPGTSLAVALLSATREAAKRVPLAEVASKLQLSPYFAERCPFKVAATMYEIRFPSKRMMVIAGSTASAAIGTNVFAGFLDEMAFMGSDKKLDQNGRLVAVDKSEILTKAIVRRMKSRFQKVGRLPGLMFLVSSKERPVAFIEKKIEEARESNDPLTFIREYATWDVKPSVDFSGKTFRVAVGNDRYRSKLDPNEVDEEWYLEQGLRVIDVPDDYRQDFERDLEGSLRDIAGLATETVSPFIHRIEKIQEAVVESLPSPCVEEEWVQGDPLEFIWERVAQPYERRLPGGYTETAWRPLRHPESVRHVHIDPSLTGDSAGIFIGHIAGWTEVVRRDKAGEEYSEIAPIVESDLALKVTPTPGDEIVLSNLRWIVYQFMEHGFSVTFASCDSYQSADTLQQFRGRGVRSEVQSIDKTTIPYDLVKTALYEGRLRLQPNSWLVLELQQLMKVPKPRAKGYKIDHPRIGKDGNPGTKDVADGLAGVVYSLTQKEPGRPIPMTTSAPAPTAEEVTDHSWVTEGRQMVKQEAPRTTRPTPRQNRGMGGETLPFVRG